MLFYVVVVYPLPPMMAFILVVVGPAGILRILSKMSAWLKKIVGVTLNDAFRGAVTRAIGWGKVSTTDLPDNYVLIPEGAKRQVQREEEFTDTLAGLVMATESGTARLIATLKSTVQIRPRSTAEVIEVAVDGKTVGFLSDAQSKNLLPLVAFIESQEKIAACRAEIIGTTIQAKVVLRCADAQQVSQRWLSSISGKHPLQRSQPYGQSSDQESANIPEYLRPAEGKKEGVRGKQMGEGSKSIQIEQAQRSSLRKEQSQGDSSPSHQRSKWAPGSDG